MKKLSTRFLGIFLMLYGYSFAIGRAWEWFMIKEPGVRVYWSIGRIGYLLFLSGNYELYRKFKDDNKWDLREERNALILLGIGLILGLIIAVLSR